MGILLLVIIIILLLGAYPRQGSYNADWGPAPAGGLGLVLLIVLILLFFGHLPIGHYPW